MGICLWALSSVLCGWIYAGEAAVALPQAKVAIVRIQAVFNQYDYVRDEYASMQAKLKPRVDRRDALARELDAKRKDPTVPMLRQGSPGYEKFQSDMESLIANIRREEAALMVEVTSARNQLMVRFYDSFRAACLLACQYYKADILLCVQDTELPKEMRERLDEAPSNMVMAEITGKNVIHAGAKFDLTDGVLYYMNLPYRQNKQNPAQFPNMFPTAPIGFETIKSTPPPTWTSPLSGAPAGTPAPTAGIR
jgi:hypothetical protein